MSRLMSPKAKPALSHETTLADARSELLRRQWVHAVAAIDQLCAVIEAENASLRPGRMGAPEVRSREKARYLFELENNLTPEVLAIAPADTGRSQLSRLRDVLACNSRLLERYREATNSVIETMVEAIRDHESDGTYSIGRAARKR